ncbi:MAG: glycosyltransferase, partial [Lentisphaeria bacterium]|nr:glycosyltransferase [Lentisphaeria bacterium]
TEKQKKHLPPGITGISRTESAEELAQLYSAADVFVNPTWEDNYPTTNLEAISCGTQVVTYRTGGSPESVTEGNGLVVEKGNLEQLASAIRKVEKTPNTCRKYALSHFRREDRFNDYIKLYDRLLQKQ